MSPRRLFAALAHLTGGDPGDDLSEQLETTVRQAAALSRADVAILRLHRRNKPSVEIRVPEDADWPSARVVERWLAKVVEQNEPLELTGRGRRLRAPLRSGLVLPIAAQGGMLGALVLLSSSADSLPPARWLGALLVAQAGAARTAIEQLRRDTRAAAINDMRDRVAREIHDGPLQVLTGLILHLRLARATIRPRTSKAFDDLESETEQAIRQMRALIRNLRITRAGVTLEERVKETLVRLERSRGMAWSLKWRGPEYALDEETADEIFYVINEALANVYRHASASRVEVRARVRERTFEVMVRDDGVGFDVAEALRQDMSRLSFGLMTMQERMRRLGGSLVLRSQSGRGTRVLITMPVSRLQPGKGGRAGTRRWGTREGQEESRLSG